MLSSETEGGNNFGGRALECSCSLQVALENRRPQTEAPGFAEHLEEIAAEEVKLQFLEGPFYSLSQVTEVLGHDQWRIMRRFVIEQGSKLRPIDDGLEAQLNSAYSSTIRLDLQDADYVVALTLELGRTKSLLVLARRLTCQKRASNFPSCPPIGTWQSPSSVTGMGEPGTISLTRGCSVPLQRSMRSTESADPCGSSSMCI